MSFEALWTCARCGRTFRQPNQSHSCGVGSRDELLRGKPETLSRLFGALEREVRAFGRVEIVFRGRYALFRTTRIFADVVFMRDALRLALLLDREVEDPLFFKAQRLGRRVAHVAKLRSAGDLRAVARYLEEAYRFAVGEVSPTARERSSRRAAGASGRPRRSRSRAGTAGASAPRKRAGSRRPGSG